MITKKQCNEMLAIYFEESDEIRPAHLLYKDLQSVRPDISKLGFYIIAMTGRGAHDGKAIDGNLGWSLKLRSNLI